MAQVNTLSQSQLAKNTGLVAVAFDPKRIAGAILVPKGYSLTAAQVATLQAKMTADAANDSKVGRIYPIANFLDFKDNSEKPVKQSFSTGAELTVRDGVYKWDFTFTKGALTLLSALRVFNGANWDALLVDDGNTIIGQVYTDATGGLGLKAIPLIEFYANSWAPNDGKKVTEYSCSFTFFPRYINELIGFIKVDPVAEFDVLATVVGLKDANLKVVASGTSGTYTMKIFDDTNENLYLELKTAIVSAVLQIKNAQTGAAITITSVTPDDTNQQWTIVVPTTGAYPTGASDKVSFNLVGPTELIAANVEGIESQAAALVTKN